MLDRMRRGAAHDALSDMHKPSPQILLNAYQNGQREFGPVPLSGADLCNADLCNAILEGAIL
jgi:uncharacterized protein YjbI with pentapeptide repeats